jgi:5-methyltetrahydrofolate--homocysteine methyltransferase
MLTFDSTMVQAMVSQALAVGLAPFEIVTNGLAAAMQLVGERYERKECFLPELVMAAATMKAGLAVLQPLLAGSADAPASKGTVVIGTVQGDVHDIGKNLVKALLEAGGFTVLDIGVNQPAEAFVAKARQHSANLVALSALLTTTMPAMAHTIAALRTAGLIVPVMVGGAPINLEFAARIGAQGYAPDAVKAVREAERLISRLGI